MARNDGALVRARIASVLTCALALVVSGCAAGGESDDPSNAAASASGGATPSATASAPANAVPVSEVRMARPAALRTGTVSPDIMVSGGRTIPASTIAKIRKITGVAQISSFSVGRFYSEEREVTYAAVDPATFRRFTPAGSATTQAIWNRVAGGEMAVRQDLGKKLQDAKGYVKMGNDADAPLAHVGAYAPMVSSYDQRPVIDAVVNSRWAGKLGMTRGNALLVSTGEAAPKKVAATIAKLVGKKTGVQILAVNLDVNATQTAVLTGGSVSSALGTLRYTANPNGTVNPDPAWVKEYIRTEQVPILGTVRCNKIMLPELRAALTEVVARGLADKVHPGEYGGCFVPRYIAGSNTLSFHTFGTAIDINVPGNERGTVGQMDRTVVAIFKKWGFGWGGDWGYTDPMHFELHRLVKAK